MRRQSIAAGIILISGNLIGMLSVRSKPSSFDIWVINTAECEKDDLPDMYGAMYMTLGATGTLAVFPFIVAYHQTHHLKLQSAPSRPVWIVKVICFVSSLAIAVSISIFGDKAMTIDAGYWKGIVQFELILVIIGAVLALFMPMLFLRLGLLELERLPDQQVKNAHAVDFGL